MKIIKMNNIELLNFKGIKSLKINFSNETNIYGHNETGKTTIMDAFIWLLFGKDSTDRKDFQLKTNDANGVAIEKLEHTVKATLNIEGKTTFIERTLKEKWQKKRGSDVLEFIGNETLYYVDEVPYQAQQYKTFINSIVDELIFKMVTNPLHFNSMKWTDRRITLTKIAGDIDEKDILNKNPDYQKLIDRLSGKSFQAYKTEISAKKKKINDDLVLIPSRIDEVTRALPEKEPDYAEVERNIKSYQGIIDNIEDKIADKSKVSESVLKVVQEKQKKIYSLKENIQEIEFIEQKNINKEYNEKMVVKAKIETDILEIQELINILEKNNTKLQEDIDGKTKAKDILLKKWHEENDIKFVMDETKLSCPTCKRPFDDDDVSSTRVKYEGRFNKNKLEILEGISKQGKEFASKIEQLHDVLILNNKTLPGKYEYIKVMQGKVNAFNNTKPKAIDLSENNECNTILADIDKLQAAIDSPRGDTDTSKLKAEKADIILLLDERKTKLAIKDQVKKSKNRIIELEEESRNLSQQIANLEKDEFIIEQFDRSKIDMIEKRVNEMFKYVKFKMFNTLINGAVEECCDTLYNGVPWPEINSSHKIWCGIDIINCLSEFHSVTAPIFIDNREGIVNLPETRAQIINLIVSEKDKTLRIDTFT